MRTGIWVALGVVVAGVGVAAAFLLQTSSVLVTAGPNAEIAPAGLVAYAEIDDLRTHADKIETTEAWIDLQGSELLARIRDTETGKAWTDLVAQIETKADYRIDRKRLMHFLGRELSVGIDAPPETGDPSWIVLTKLDIDGLVREMLHGQGDWTKLRDELDRRTGAMDFQVARSDHKGHAVTTATRGDVSFHVVLLGDTLVVSDSPALLRRAVDVHDAGGAGSIAKTPRFRDEMARLAPGFVERDWVDLEGLRAAQSRLLAWANSRDPSGGAAAMFERILEGTSGAPALARGTALPESDLYQVRWSYSRTAVELAGTPAAADPAAYVRGSTWLLETRDPGRVVRAWNDSSVRRRLADGPLGKKLREWADAPKEALAAAQKDLPMFGGLSAGGPSDADPGANPAVSAGREAGRLLVSDPFTLKMVTHLAWESLLQGVTGDFAMGGGVPDTAGDLEFSCALRLGTEGYLAVLAVEGLGLSRRDGLERTSRGATTVFRAARDAKTAAWTHVGDLVVVASDDQRLGRALDGAAAATPPEASALPPGHCLRVAWTAAAFDAVVERLRDLGANGSTAFADALPGAGEFAVYVDDAFRTIESRMTVTLRRDPPTTGTAGEPRTWGWVPDDAILSSCASIDVSRMLDSVFDTFGADVRESFDKGVHEAEGDLGVSIRGELVPALGPEIAIALTRRDAPQGRGPDGGPPPFLPGVLLSIEVKDEAVVGRALDGLVRTIQRDESRVSVHRESADGWTTLTFQEPDMSRAPVRIVPTVAWGHGKLLAGVDDTVVRAAIAAGAGRAPSFAKGALHARVVAAQPDGGHGWMVLDGGRLLDQVAAYAPHLAQAFPPDELPDGRKRPEFPDQFEDGAFEKYQRDSQAFAADAARAREPEIRKWIDSFRVLDFVAWSYRDDGRTETGHLTVRFTE